MQPQATAHRIVVVGGGAGGLELATRLGDKLGKRGRASVTLIDAELTHLWKPLLHEVAAGTRDSHEDELSYIAQGHWHHFHFRLGRLEAIDRERREVALAPMLDREGDQLVPRRVFGYDTLVLAIGSQTNAFATPGVDEHCAYLDNREQADLFHQRFFEAYLKANVQRDELRPGQLDVAIVGGGATGIELAAELHEAARAYTVYGLDRVAPDRHMKISIIEAGERILPALPPELSEAVAGRLEEIGVRLHTGEQVTEVTAAGVRTRSGLFVPALTKVWAAGIKAPDVLQGIGGLESNARNQLVVRPTLQTTRDDAIYALGDCAQCALADGTGFVPPRAQAAHQQANLIYRSIRCRIAQRPLPEYHYRDIGSLVSLSGHSTIGNLMGNLTGDVMISGKIARFVYYSLYRMHLNALHGAVRTTLMELGKILSRRTRARFKLH
jgi:NADH dehydrogenase